MTQSNASLLETVQEQRAEIEELKSQLKDQKTLVDEIARLDAIRISLLERIHTLEGTRQT